MAETYIGFYSRASLAECWREGKWSMFGHVEAWGYQGESWWFLNPLHDGTRLVIEHRHDEVTEFLAARFAACSEILRVRAFHVGLRIPFHPTMTCAAQVGHLFGVRAYAPWTLRRILLAHGAEVIHAAQGSEGGPGGQEGAGARAAAC